MGYLTVSEIKTYRLPYEFLLRWSFGADADGKPVAVLSGAQYQERYVRAEAGKLRDGGPCPEVQPISPTVAEGPLAGILSEAQTSAFAALAEEQAESARLRETLTAREREIEALEKALSEANGEVQRERRQRERCLSLAPPSAPR